MNTAIFENGRIKLIERQKKRLVFITLPSRPKAHKDSKTGYKGVDLYAPYERKGYAKPYRARITIRGKQVFLGLYATAREAYSAYRKASIAHFGKVL